MGSKASDAAADPVEERLRAALAPHLQLVRPIGAGGMARVYLAREPALKRLVAVKVLASDYATTPEGRARFEREAQAVAGLSHPNIVSIHTVGELDDGTPYFIMQYVEGASLAHRVQTEGPLSVFEARRVLGEVAAALAAAHKQRIIHRDIKPANILFEEATGRSLVSDFGIAAVSAQGAGKDAMRLTGTGVLVGTPMYMSPEQLLAEPVSEKTDIYSLGLLAHELLNGVGPFQASSPHELIAAYLRDTPARLSKARPEVDTEFDELIARCLEKDAAKRPTADEVAKRLSPGGATLLEWPAPGLEELHGQLRPVSKAYWWGAGLIVATIIAALEAGPGIESVAGSLITIVMLTASIAGALMLLGAVRRTVRVGNNISNALRAGYGGMTVLETLCDTRGDTGNIISASREYSALDPASRDRVRRERIQKESLFFVAGFGALPLLIAVLILGSLSVFGPGASWLALGIPGLMALTAIVLAARERSAFAKARKRRSAVTQSDARRLAGPWNDAFEATRVGQSLGRGRLVAPHLGRFVAITAAAAAGIITLLLTPLIGVSAIGPSYWATAFPKFANTRSKLFIQRPARRYRLPLDSAITPLEAGRAYFALVLAGGDKKHRSFVELPPPTPALPPFPWAVNLPVALFPNARPDQEPGLPAILKIIPAARAGFTAGELAYLERIAHAPHWKTVETIARAPRMDYIGARYKVPFDENALVWEFPIPRFASTKSVAYASLSRSAYYLARNQRDSAEIALRQTISFGFVMADNATTLIEQLVGTVIAGIGREGLIQYYKAVGDPRGVALRAQIDSMIAIVEGKADGLVMGGDENIDIRNPVAARREFMRVASDPNELRGLRFEMLSQVAFTPCTNVREMIFGADTDAVATFARARTTWARFKSDSAMLDMMFAQTERLDASVKASSRSRTIYRVAQPTGALLGNRRLAGCAATFALRD